MTSSTCSYINQWFTFTYNHDKSTELLYSFTNNHYIHTWFEQNGYTEFENILKTENFKISDDNYILCPVYVDRKTGKYDFQIGISGSVKYSNVGKENLFQAITREVGEEVGLVVSELYTPKDIMRQRNYVFKLEYLKDVPKTYSNLLINPNPDIPKEKVYCIIHDSEINIDMYLSQNNIYRYKNTDDIVAVGKLNVSEVKKYLSYKNRWRKY
jgi:hypothetical protein